MKRALFSVVAAACCLTSFAQIAPTEPNLRSAIAAGGTIRFSGSGVIPITAPLAVTKDAVIDGGANSITLDGQSATNIFTVGAGVHLSLTNITLANGAVIMPMTSGGGVPAPATGGAIQNNDGVIVAVDCVFSNNLARGADAPLFSVAQGGSALGGAIWQSDGSLSVQGGAFLANATIAGKTPDARLSRGGAICAEAGLVEVDNVMFAGNAVGAAPATATAGPFPSNVGKSRSSGGAIALGSGTLRIKNSKLWNNVAQGASQSGRGGAISLDGGAATIADTYFLSNEARSSVPATGPGTGFPGDGGALYNGTNANVSISNCTFEKCISVGRVSDHSPFYVVYGPAHGGAIFNSGVAALVNSTLYGNVANGYSLQEAGGAIYNDGAIGLTNVTVSGNSSPQPILYSASGSLVLKNSLLGENDGVTATNVVDAGNNLSATSSPIFTSDSSQNSVNLRLGTLGDYGGATPTIPLLAGSPAIDAADDAAAPSMDQRGFARPYGAHADVGAFESGALFQVVGFDVISQQVTLAFHAVAGETWRFDASTDLVQWTPIRTNTFTSDSVFSAPVVNAGATTFVRAVRQ